MAQFYNLDEASARLGVSPEEFKKKLREEWKSVRSFRDGATLRFRAADIDELARTLGQASDPGLPLGSAAGPLSDSSEELSLEPPKPPASKPKPGSGKNLTSPSGKNLKPPSGTKAGREAPLFLSDDSDDIFALPTEDASKPKSKPKRGKTDSDVRLDQTPQVGGIGGGATEEIELDLPPASGVGLGKSSGKLTAPKSSGKMSGGAKIPGPTDSADDGSSEFELSLDSDSDSFELKLTDDSSEEDALGGALPSGGGVQSGINLGRPSDSGVSLEKKGKSKPPVAEDDSDVSFELEMDTTGGPKSRPIPSAASGGMGDEGSSEFELTLDDSDGSESMNALAAGEQNSGDIFETDFELPVMDGDESGSEVLAVDSADTDLENSDFDLAIDEADAPADDESASQVVLMDDDGEPMLDADDAVALEDEPMVEEDDENLQALGGKSRSRGVVETRVVEREKIVAPPPPKWGIVPLLALAPTFLVVVFGSLMGFEVIRSMSGYQQPAAAPIVRPLTKAFGWSTGD